MAADRQLALGLFRFDTRTGQLWRDGSEVKLTPRAGAVLHVLAGRAQELVTKQELFDRVWGGMAVSDNALTSCIQELRDVLGDDSKRPRYIETRYRRGYRLMVPATSMVDRPRAAALAPVHKSPTLVGRTTELEELGRGFEQALRGRCQMLFITGESGIGKSALVSAFAQQIAAGKKTRIAQGQCLDHHGVGEPYLPLIEALTRLAGGPDGAAAKEVLAAHAPSWLAQMPSLWTRSERRALEARGRATRERMLRELTLALEAITAQAPLLLTLEDIHWSDVSTLDWLAHVTRRPEPAHLMLLATFRPADAAAVRVGLGGIVAELALHGCCQEIALNPLNLQAVEAYLKARLGERDGMAQLREIAPVLLKRSGGNPLFMTSIVNHLAQQDTRARTPAAIVSIPDDVRRFIERQIDELDENDRNLLSAASVISREFATAAVAAALEANVEQIEVDSARLARQGVFIVKSGSTTWPDGARVELYMFRHDLYRELLYDRSPPTRRARFHARVGRRLEAAWAGRLEVVAVEIAEHFERGNELARAIPHHQRAAATALRRGASEEALGHLRRALDAVGHIADEAERIKLEIEMHVGIGAVYMATHGYGAPEVLASYARAQALCDRLGERADIFPALWGQWLFRSGRNEVESARQLCTRLMTLAEKSGDAGLRLQAHHAAWSTSLQRGELAETCAHAEAGLALYDAKTHQAMASSYGNHDAGTCARNFAACALALSGDEERARAMADNALAVAKNLNDPFSLALTLYFLSIMAQVLGDVSLATENSEACIRIATEHDFPPYRAWGTGVAGWCIAKSGDADRGIALLIDAIGALHAMQTHAFIPYFLGLLADAHANAGHHAEAMKVAEEGIAFAKATGERFYIAELYRLRGELCAHPAVGQRQKAEESLRLAINIAKQQGAAALERKATECLRRYFA